MRDRIKIDQAVAFGRTYGFSMYPDEECATGPLLGFHDYIYPKLIEQGHITGEYWPSDLDFCELFREGICLVYNVDAQEDLFYDELPENITPFLKHAHLAEYMAKPIPTVRLISKEPLWRILPKYLEAAQNHNFPGPESEEPCRLRLKSYVKHRIEYNPDYSGRTMACDFEYRGMECRIPGCYSELTWIRKGIILIYMCGGAEGIKRAWLLPSI